MKAFKVVLSFEEKTGFTQEGLKVAIQNDLSEVGLRLLNFVYESLSHDSCPEYPLLNKKLSSCECIIEHKSFSPMIPFYQIVLGGFQGISEKYPFIEINSIDPSEIEI